MQAFDSAIVQRVMPLLKVLKRYLRAEVTGLENIPDGPVVLAGNHNAGIIFFEAFRQKIQQMMGAYI